MGTECEQLYPQLHLNITGMMHRHIFPKVPHLSEIGIFTHQNPGL